MLKINVNEWFDLNYIGLFITGFIMLLVLFFNLDILLKLLIEMMLLLIIYQLNKQIANNKYLAIIINNEGQWFVQQHKQMQAVQLKDYWLQGQKIFIWLQAERKSVSFVVSRSIIGAAKFSQLRTKII